MMRVGDSAITHSEIVGSVTVHVARKATHVTTQFRNIRHINTHLSVVPENNLKPSDYPLFHGPMKQLAS